MYILIIIAALLIWSLIEQKLLITSEYTIPVTGSGQSLPQVSFIVLSDLHNHTFGRNNKRLLERIHRLKPGFIVIAGDMITKEQACIPSNAYTLLEELSKTYTVYYAYGNHEQKFDLYLHQPASSQKASANHKEFLTSTWVEYKKKLMDSGVIFLENESSVIEVNGEKLRMTGAALDKRFYERSTLARMEENYIESIIGKREDNMYQILIAHHPLYFEEYVSWGADLIIAGHLHGGLVRIPKLGGMLSPQAKFFPKYDAGCFSRNGRHMIVSRGLGTHSYMPRLFNIPELVYIKLDPKRR